MDNQYDKNEKMKLIGFRKPALGSGRHKVEVTQKVRKPAEDTFKKTEYFYVASRAYTLDADTIFSVSPSENECGDFSRQIPFITLKNETMPWEYTIAEEINGVPVPWAALIVIAEGEGAEESDITVEKLLGDRQPRLFFPDRSLLPKVTAEKGTDCCHVVDISRQLYLSIMPTFEEMTYLTHGKRVDLADTEDEVTAMNGDFSVIMANRFIPTGEKEMQKSTVHLVSMLGMPEKIPDGYDKIRLVSLHRFSVFSARSQSETFASLIEKLSRNTGVIGYDQEKEVLKKGYVPKKHYTRSGEMTYSLYRSPFLPYEGPGSRIGPKHTADGYLVYDPENGIFDVSYAAAFQMGRLAALSRKPEGALMVSYRKKQKLKMHRRMLEENLKPADIYEAVKNMPGM